MQQLPWCEAPTHTGPSLRFAYAGTPGKKDLIKVVIEGLRLADPSGRVCRLDIAGMTTDDVADLSVGRDGIPEFGTRSWPTAQDPGSRTRIRSALHLLAAPRRPLRRPRRVSDQGGRESRGRNAGDDEPHFGPGCIRRDSEETGFIIEEPSADSFADSVRDALSVSPAAYLAMRRAARAEAEAHFDFRGYAPALRDFVERSLISASTGRRRWSTVETVRELAQRRSGRAPLVGRSDRVRPSVPDLR